MDPVTAFNALRAPLEETPEGIETRRQATACLYSLALAMLETPRQDTHLWEDALCAWFVGVMERGLPRRGDPLTTEAQVRSYIRTSLRRLVIKARGHREREGELTEILHLEDDITPEENLSAQDLEVSFTRRVVPAAAGSLRRDAAERFTAILGDMLALARGEVTMEALAQRALAEGRGDTLTKARQNVHQDHTRTRERLLKWLGRATSEGTMSFDDAETYRQFISEYLRQRARPKAP